MKPNISIIIPVFNAAPYLERCVESLLGQTLSELEFIFINDGSTDASLEILENYERRDSRIRVISQPNQGVSVARNIGIELARADYIAFVDADDMVDLTLYQKLYDIVSVTVADLVLFNMRRPLVTNSSSSFNYPAGKILDEIFIRKVIYRDLIAKDQLFSSCNKLYKASIIHDNKITFPVGNNLSEDNVFNLNYIKKIQSVYYLDFAGYLYRETENSATQNFMKNDFFENYLQIFHFDYAIFINKDLPAADVLQLKSFKFLNNIISTIYIYFTTPIKTGFAEKCKMVKRIAHHSSVKEALATAEYLYKEKSNTFETAMLNALKHRMIFILYLLSKYSQFRNK